MTLDTIDKLIRDLGSRNMETRLKAARVSVRTIGAPAVGPLIRALGDPDEEVRWGAVRALRG